MNNKKPPLLILFLILLTLNATITVSHYVLIFLKIIPIKGDINTRIEFTFADIVATVIPSLIGAYKLWQLKKSGWVFVFYSFNHLSLATTRVV